MTHAPTIVTEHEQTVKTNHDQFQCRTRGGRARTYMTPTGGDDTLSSFGRFLLEINCSEILPEHKRRETYQNNTAIIHSYAQNPRKQAPIYSNFHGAEGISMG